jgi:hypothetical protein
VPASVMRERVLIWGVVTGCLLLAAGSVVSGASSAVTAGGCYPAGSHTLLSTATLRVYRTRTIGRGEAASDLIVACWLASARQTMLVAESPHNENNQIRLIALKLAPGSTSMIGVTSATVGVGLVETDLLATFNARSGRRLASNEAELSHCEEGCRINVSSFVVTPTGALAFIGADDPGGAALSSAGLYTIAPGGRMHLLEPGGGPRQPQPGSPTISDLAYANGVVSWKSNGSPMSSPLS